MPKPLSLTTTAARVARAAIAADAVAGHDAPELLRRAMASLGRAVPFDAAGFCPVDPDTMLWTGGVVMGLPVETIPQFFEAELLAGDPLAFRDMVRAGRTAGTLAGATGGRPERSLRHRRMYQPNGIDAELRVAFTANGVCWGTACLLRSRGAADFSPREVAWIADVARDIGDGLRAAFAWRREEAAVRPVAQHAGVVVVDDELRTLSITDEAALWLEELRAGDPSSHRDLPSVVHSVVARARHTAAGAAGPRPRARLRTAAGRWVVVHASALSGDQRAWAIMLEPARPTEMLTLLAAGHDLTPREQEVLGLLLRGLPDRAVAEELVVSAHTAREHAGRVLQKFSVRSRGELQALLFDAHYDPWSETVTPSSPE